MNYSSRTHIIVTLTEMEIPVHAKNDNELVGEFLSALGIEPEFLCQHSMLIQVMNENASILAKVVALCFPQESSDDDSLE